MARFYVSKPPSGGPGLSEILLVLAIIVVGILSIAAMGEP
mgnify:CR=1 FL=1